MVRWDRWGRRMWWVGPAVVGAIGALGVAAVVVGPELADSVSVPSHVEVGSNSHLSAARVSASHPPPIIVTTAPTAPPKPPSGDGVRPAPAPAPTANAVGARPMSNGSGTGAPAGAVSTPTPAPTHVVSPQRPVVERESPEPGDGGNNAREVDDG